MPSALASAFSPAHAIARAFALPIQRIKVRPAHRLHSPMLKIGVVAIKGQAVRRESLQFYGVRATGFRRLHDARACA